MTWAWFLAVTFWAVWIPLFWFGWKWGIPGLILAAVFKEIEKGKKGGAQNAGEGPKVETD